MATRFYLGLDAAEWRAPVVAAFQAGWNTAPANFNRRLVTDKNDVTSAGQTGVAGSGVSGNLCADAYHWLSAPLSAQVISGTLKGQHIVKENVSTDNYTSAIAARVIAPDGTERGTLLAAVASNTSTTPPEMDTASANRRFLSAADSASLTLSSVTALEGDRLCIEIGHKQASTSTNSSLHFYGVSGADLPEDDTTTSGTSWVEFSGTITFTSQPFYFGGSAPSPADNGTQNEPVTAALTPPSNMVAGDLVVMIGTMQVATTGQNTLSATGGQTWFGPFEQAANDIVCSVFWCVYNGTWGANPSIAFASQSGTQPCSAVMHVFRDPNGGSWALDTAFAGATEASASPMVVSGITPGVNAGITLAGWFITNASTWGTLSGAGWVTLGTAQYRNTAGTALSATFAYFPRTNGGATGNVSKIPSTATLGVSFTMSWGVTSVSKVRQSNQAGNRASTF